MTKAIEHFEAFEHHRQADSFDFRRSWEGVRHACRTHKLLIVATCVASLGLMMLYVRVWPPVFVATVTLVGESPQDPSRGNFYQTWQVFRNDQLSDEVHMITSGPVLSQVIQRMKLTEDDVYHSFFSYAGLLWTRSYVGRQYRELKELFFPRVRQGREPTPEQEEEGRVLLNMRSGVQLDRVMESNLGKLTVRAPTPAVADMANTIIAVYMQQRRARHLAEADSAYQSLKSEADKAEAEIKSVEDRMRQYYSENNILLSFEKDKIDIGQMQAMKASIEELQAGVASNEQVLSQIGAELAGEPRYVVSARVTGVNPLFDGLRTKLSELQISRKQSLIHYRPDSPEITEIDRQIAILSAQLGKEPASNLQQNTTVMSGQYEVLRGKAAELRATLAGQRAALEVKSNTYSAYQTLLTTLPEKMRSVHDLDREHTAAEKKFAAIQEKMTIAAVSRASANSDSESIRVVEAADYPAEASWPRTKLLLGAALAVGLVAGVLLALLMDLFFGRVHRFRLAGMGDLQVYAMVRRDRRITMLFALPRRTNSSVRLLSND